MSARDLFYSEGKEFSNAEEKAYAREDLVYNVTEDILLLLEDTNISKKELARRLGKSRSFVTQILSGTRNMTLGSLSDICFVLGIKPRLNFADSSTGINSIEEHDIPWEGFIIESKNNRLIQKSKNVIDCRGQQQWETQAA